MPDAELDAVRDVAAALEPLDVDTRKRVLQWAQDRFIEGPKRNIDQLQWAAVDAQIKAYKKYAAEMGVDDRQLAHALAHVRSLGRLAPIATDPEPEATADEAVRKVSPDA